MSKKYKGGNCVYCDIAPASTADHLFAREFFLKEHRNNLPKVPACARCNGAKSQLEHYLTAILPFGGRHRHSRRTLAEMVPGRLARNQRLHQLLKDRMQPGWSHENGVMVRTSGIPVDHTKLLRLLDLIARGLVWYHWKARITTLDEVNVWPLWSHNSATFDGIISKNAARRVAVNLGEGTFVYEGAQGVDVDVPQLSAWRITGYGGMQFSDPRSPEEICSVFGILTGPRPLSQANT